MKKVINNNSIIKFKGGVAIPLDKVNKLFYLSGAKHEQGGIDVTPELEAEGGEVIKVNPKSIKVVTAQKIMGGKSPAELVVNASSTGEQDKVFNKVFKYQEDFKDRHNLNDDGTKKKFGGKKKKLIGGNEKEFKLGELMSEFYTPQEKTFYEKTLPPVPYRPKKEAHKYPLSYKTEIKHDDYMGVPEGFVDITDDIKDGDLYVYTYPFNAVYHDPTNNRYYAEQWSTEGVMNLSGFNKYNLDQFRKILPKRDYIGGDKRDVGIKIINKVPGLKDTILSLSNKYGISPDVFAQRLSYEGWLQQIADNYNTSSVAEQKTFPWQTYMDMEISGYDQLGLDTFGDHLKAGDLNLRRNFEYRDTYQKNEDKTGNIYNSGLFNNAYDALEAKAAMLEYFTKIAKKRNISEEDLDTYVNAMYNMGEHNDSLKNSAYIKKKYSFKPYFKYGGQTKNITKKKVMGGNKSTKTWQQTSRESMKENLSGMVNSIKYLNTNRQERYNATGEKSSFNEFTNNWYNHPTTKGMMEELNAKSNLLPSQLTVPTTSGEISLTPNQQMTYHLYGAMSTPMKYQNLIATKAGHYSKPELGNINMSNTARLNSNNYFNFNVKDPKYLDDYIRLDPNKGMDVDYLKTHEIDHAVQARMPFLLDTTKQFNTELKEGITPDSYLDSKGEIRSRLMELRQHFNLDPSKRDYTPEEAAKFQEEIKHLNTGASTLDRYTPETLANYLNFMANNTVNKSYNNLHNTTNIKGRKIAKWGTQYKNKSGKTIIVKPAISQLSVPSNMIGSATIQTPTPFVPKKWEDTNKINLNPTEEIDKLLNAGDWINLGLNSAGALTNLITGLATPNIRYARMKDATPIIAPKINANVNTNAEESAIDEQYYNELNAIDENTANSQTALNRKRNAAARRAAAKVKVRSAAENTRRDLINKGNILKGEYDKFNIQRQDQIDAYNAQADAAEFNANRTKIGDAITGFVSDLGLGASTIINTLEQREADRINTILSYMGKPEVNPSESGKGIDQLYEILYGKKPSKYLRKKYSKR